MPTAKAEVGRYAQCAPNHAKACCGPFALFDMTEGIEGAEMAIEQGNPARIMDALHDLRSRR